MTPITGFAPDLDATTPGVITDCTNFIPYESGMRGSPSPVTPDATPALADDCRNAAVLTLLNNTRRIFAGTQTKMYELTGGVWDDVSRVGDYAGGTETRWSFAQFGDSSLCANKIEVIQRSPGSGDFADIASAPKAKIIFSVGAFVMALNVDDGTDKPDGWHCCAAFDDTDWVEAVATQCASGRLVSSPGPLTAGLRLGEYAIAYKERSIYLGQYVGAPAVWDWIQVPGGDSGAIGQDALCDIGGTHFFVGNDNFWVFDGTKPVPVGDEIRQWFFNNSDPTYRYKTQCVFDRQNNLVWVHFVSNGASTLDSAVVFHVKNKNQRWGQVSIEIEAALNYVASGITYDTWDTAGATYDTLPDIPYDSQYWLAGGRAPSIFNSSHQLQLLTGASTNSGFVTGDAGDDEQVTDLTQIRLRYAAGFKPQTSQVTTYYKKNEGDDLILGSTIAESDGKFDVRQSAEFHRAEFAFTGDVRVTGLRPTLAAAGNR